MGLFSNDMVISGFALPKSEDLLTTVIVLLSCSWGLGEGETLRLPSGGCALTGLGVSRFKLLRLLRRGDFGKLVVMLALVVLKKLELATLRKVVGRDLRIR